jgi:hypothetical protein
MSVICFILRYHCVLYYGELWGEIFSLWNQLKFVTWSVIGNCFSFYVFSLYKQV